MIPFRQPQRSGPEGATEPPRLHWSPDNQTGGGRYAVVERSVRTRIAAVDGCPVMLQVPHELVLEALVDLRDGEAVALLVAVRLDAPAARYRVTDLVLRPAAADGLLETDVLKLVPMSTVLAEGLIRVPHHVQLVGRPGQEPGEPVVIDDLEPNEYLAVLWLLAQLAGAEPNVFIADDLGISAQAAAQRVARARRAGLIPPASRPGARR
jgi:hypothetical protein